MRQKLLKQSFYSCVQKWASNIQTDFVYLSCKKMHLALDFVKMIKNVLWYNFDTKTSAISLVNLLQCEDKYGCFGVNILKTF